MELTDFSKELPNSIEAEQTVLGALLISPDLLSVTFEYIKAESFYSKKHKVLYEIIVKMFAGGARPDLITVLNEAVSEGIFESAAEGKEYLLTIMNLVPSTGNISSYCKIVADKALLRSLILVSSEITDIAYTSQEDASAALETAEQKIFDLRQGRQSQSLTKIDEVVVQAFDKLQKLNGPDRELYLGAKSGFSDLDSIISGLNPSDLLIIAARPGMGKTSFALNIATNVCERVQKQAVIFSLEMSNEQLVTRMLSSEARVASQDLRSGHISNEDWKLLAEGAELLSKMQIFLDDTPGITVGQMKAKLRRLKDVGLVIIDYLQLMSAGRAIDSRVTEISEITRQLKLMAKELNVPVITLSQLARGPESRTDHRPLLSDLRDSGSIEQDADIVMFLYRDAYYNKESPEQNKSECIVAKNRHGETGTVPLTWDGQFTRFSNYIGDYAANNN